MNGFLLFIPFLLIRFGLLYLLDKDAIKRAAHFAPVIGREMAAYWLYQLSNLAILALPCFLKVETEPLWVLCSGITVYGLGVALCAASVVSFARPSGDGMNIGGLYRFSRNPMYVAYFVYFLGCALLTQSWVLSGVVLLFQIAAHFIILAEERWCTGQFGEEYLRYKISVRRYL